MSDLPKCTDCVYAINLSCDAPQNLNPIRVDDAEAAELAGLPVLRERINLSRELMRRRSAGRINTCGREGRWFKRKTA